MLKRGSDSSALFLFLSLTPAFRHSDILWHNVENRVTQGSFSFSFFTPNESQRPSPCRERVVYPLLIAVFCGRGGHSGAPFLFFFSLRICHLADLFRSFSPAFLIKRAFSGFRQTHNVEGVAAESIAG